MTATATIIIAIVFLAIVFVGLGILIGRFKSKKVIEKIDKQINLPENVAKIKKLSNAQEEVMIKREVNESGRRRAIFRGYGDKGLSPIDSRAGKPTTQEQDRGIGEPDSIGEIQGADVRRSELQDSDLSDSGERQSIARGSEEDYDEDEHEFDWSR